MTEEKVLERVWEYPADLGLDHLPGRASAFSTRIQAFACRFWSRINIHYRKSGMHTFEEHFSEDRIIKILCSLRLKKASVVHERRFFRRIVYSGEERQPSAFYRMFPPRRTWNRFRPKKSGRRSNDDIGAATLARAIKWCKSNNPGAPWLVRLCEKANEIRLQATQGSYKFSAPSIVPLHKSNNDYRAIASFANLNDKVIDIINAKYLRDLIDDSFEECSVAFRPTRVPALNRVTAINKIIELRKLTVPATLHVAECDIRGFFDCVNQTVAKQSLRSAIRLLKARKPSAKIDRRSIEIFESYLNCYSFSQTVKSKETELRELTRNPSAVYKWPVGGKTEGPYDLKYFYKNPHVVRLGIPQGGAHSCLIANLVLDFADKETSLALQAAEGRSLYQRYCDDMIIVAENEVACRSAFDAYLKALEFSKLPYHKPVIQTVHGRDFFNESKTKMPYAWSQGGGDAKFPWTQFLGYQIRHDGLIRVRPSSIAKHKEKICALRKRIASDARTKKLKVSRRRVLYRFSSKTVAFSTGRVNLHAGFSGPLPMCWCSGFKQLHENRFIGTQIVSLDKEIGKNKRHLRQILKGQKEGPRAASDDDGKKTFFGKPFSHTAQFLNSGKGHL